MARKKSEETVPESSAVPAAPEQDLPSLKSAIAAAVAAGVEARSNQEIIAWIRKTYPDLHFSDASIAAQKSKALNPRLRMEDGGVHTRSKATTASRPPMLSDLDLVETAISESEETLAQWMAVAQQINGLAEQVGGHGNLMTCLEWLAKRNQK